MSSLVIYTDLDGTLLDHHSYDPGPARPLLARLQAEDIPVIPCTSKTRAEMVGICADLQINGPFIVENGSAVWVPEAWGLSRPPGSSLEDGFWCHVLGKSRGYIKGQLAGLDSIWRHRFHALSDMTPRQVMAVTGLDERAAQAAKSRHFSETLLWLGSAADRLAFAELVQEMGLRILQGGRFLHILAGGGKGTAMQWLHARLCEESRPMALSIAAGDAENDLELLESADYALVVRSPAHDAPVPSRSDNVVVSDAQGPAGWVEGIERIMKHLEEEDRHGRLLSERYHYNAAQSR